MKPYGGPAFPCTDGDHGMSLRDYLAVNAPIAAFEMDSWTVGKCEKELGLAAGGYVWHEHYMMLLVKLSYKWADAMLDERKKFETGERKVS